MPCLSQSTINRTPITHLPEAENGSTILRSIFENMTDNVVFLGKQDKKKTKPCIFENPHILQRLAMAFSIGGTMEEAALFAGCSVSVVKKHLRERTPFQVTTPWGEDCTVTFDEMVSGWQCRITLMAKVAIYKSLFSPDLKIATKNAWKILERQEPEEWGLKAGVTSVDDAGGVSALDLGSEGAKRAEEFLQDPNDTATQQLTAGVMV